MVWRTTCPLTDSVALPLLLLPHLFSGPDSATCCPDVPFPNREREREGVGRDNREIEIEIERVLIL